MKYLKRIKIVNYKMFEEKQISFTKDKNLIIGDNDSGKTTILKLIEMLWEKKVILEEDVIDKNKSVEITWTIRDTESEEGDTHIKAKFSNDNKWSITETNFKKMNSECSDVYEGFISEVSLISHFNNSSLSDFNKNVNAIISKEVISDLSATKEYEKFNVKLKEIADKKTADLLLHLNEKTIVNNNISNLTVINEHQLDKDFNFIIDDDQKIEGKLSNRGSGYIKNLQLLISSWGKKENKILIIDEVENSFSENNVLELMNNIESQVIATSHSAYLPLYAENSTLLWTGEGNNVIKNIQDRSKDKTLVLIEGEYDLDPIRGILGNNEYIFENGNGTETLDRAKQLVDAGIENFIAIIDHDQKPKLDKLSDDVKKKILLLKENGIEYYYKNEIIEEIKKKLDISKDLEEILSEKELKKAFKALLNKKYSAENIKDELKKELQAIKNM